MTFFRPEPAVPRSGTGWAWAPSGRRLRVPAGPAQGPGHPDPGLAEGAGRGGRRGAAARRRRSGRGPPAAPGRPARRQRRRPVHRARSRGPSCRLLRRGRRVRHAVPDPPGRARRRGSRHRLPGGVGHRPAGDRRRLGRCPDAILEGETGLRRPGAAGPAGVAERLVELLSDPGTARAMGRNGLAWVDREWRWDWPPPGCRRSWPADGPARRDGLDPGPPRPSPPPPRRPEPPDRA